MFCCWLWWWQHTDMKKWMILPLTDWPEFASWWLLCFGVSAVEKKKWWIHCSQTGHDVFDHGPRPCFCLAAVWPENLEVLYQHLYHCSVTLISVNTLTAEADTRTFTPPVPFSSVSLHIPTSPRAYKNFEEAGWDGGGEVVGWSGGGEGGGQRTIMDQHLFSLQGTTEPCAKLIAIPVSQGGFNNI